MRVFSLAVVSAIFFVSSVSAEWIDLETNMPVRVLADIENSLEVDYGVSDFDSFIAKKAQLEHTIAYLQDIEVRSGLRMMDLDGNDAITLVRADLEQLVSDYSTIDPKWEVKELLARTYGVRDFDSFTKVREKLEAKIARLDPRIDTLDGIVSLSPAISRARGEAIRELETLEATYSRIHPGWDREVVKAEETKQARKQPSKQRVETVSSSSMDGLTMMDQLGGNSLR